MARYDVVVIGAGLGGLTPARSSPVRDARCLSSSANNSVGGAASSDKSGDLFVEGSLHLTSDPHDPRDPKHRALTRAGVIDAVKWIPGGAFYEARGGPLDQPFLLPDNFDAARQALTGRFPEARAGIDQLLEEMERIASAVGTLLARQRRLQKAARSSRRPVETVICGPRLAPVAVAKADSRFRRQRSPSNAHLRPIFPIITTIPRRCGGCSLRSRREAIS